MEFIRLPFRSNSSNSGTPDPFPGPAPYKLLQLAGRNRRQRGDGRLGARLHVRRRGDEAALGEIALVAPGRRIFREELAKARNGGDMLALRIDVERARKSGGEGKGGSNRV